MLTSRALLPLVLLAAVACASCGYRVLGRGLEPGSGSRPLWLQPVEDNAAEPLFGALLGQHLSREAVNGAAFALASQDRADLALRVRVVRVEEAGGAFVVGDRPREYVVSGVVDVYLTGPDGELLWKGAGIRAAREFPAGTDVNRTEANKDLALGLLARDLSREVLRRAAVVAAGMGP